MAIELPLPRAHLPTSTVGVQAPRSKPLFEVDATVEKRRRRIWEISGHLHCSIIHRVAANFPQDAVPGVHKETDHELHVRAMLVAGKRELASKLLQKALDRRHRSAITQFNRAQDAEGVRALW